MKVWVLLMAALLCASTSWAEDAAPAPPAPGEKEPTVTDYCANFADKAAEARIAWQTDNLQKLQDEVAGKIAELEAKQKDLQQWIDKRDAMLKQAGKELVDIYAKMDPEAAAGQLAKVDTGTAVSVLRQLSPRAASTIMAAIVPERAAVLAKAIAAASLDAAPEAAKPSSTGKGT